MISELINVFSLILEIFGSILNPKHCFYSFVTSCSIFLKLYLSTLPQPITNNNNKLYPYSNQFKIITMQGQQFNYNSISCFKERPSPNIRYLINRQLPKLIEIAINQALQFVNTTQTKGKALRQLKYTVLIAEGQVTPHLQKIIKSLVKIWQIEIENVQRTIKDIMALIGFNVKSSYYLPLMMNILTEDEIKNSPKNTIILLKLISFMLQTSEDLEGHLQSITKLITTYEALFIENDEGLVTVCEIAMTLIRRLTNLQFQKLVSTIFSVMLNVEATKTISSDFRSLVNESMHILAKKAGFSSVAQLHSHEVGPVLSKIIQKKQYVSWNKTSKNRFKFDTIVRNCQSEAIKYLNQILTVLEYCISSDCDIQIRMDTLVLIEEIIGNSQIRQALKEYATRVFIKILNVAIKWKVGKPQIKIRKGGIINMIRMIQLEIINENQLLESFSQVLPHIKSCMSDDWAPELRLSCCQFLQKFLLATKENIDGEYLKDIYVILLERLDDSQDPIRKKTATAINLFFLCRYLPLTMSFSSIIEYMVNAIFVHYDDSNQEIRDAINVSLKYAAKVQPNQVLKSAKANIGKMKHKSQCQELIQFCNEVIEEKKL